MGDRKIGTQEGGNVGRRELRTDDGPRVPEPRLPNDERRSVSRISRTLFIEDCISPSRKERQGQVKGNTRLLLAILASLRVTHLSGFRFPVLTFFPSFSLVRPCPSVQPNQTRSSRKK